MTDTRRPSTGRAVRAQRLRRGAAVLVLLVTGAGMVLPSPASADEQSRLVAPDAAEAWYTTAAVTAATTACSAAPACPTAPPPPAGLPTPPAAVLAQHTLALGVTAGKEHARAYVRPALDALPTDAVIDAAHLVLPVADSASGTRSPELGHVKACLVTADFVDGVEGSLDPPPPVDCRVSTFATYAPAEAQLQVDLLVFLQAWAAGAGRHGIALLPDAGQGAATDSWQLVLNGRQRPGVPHALSTVLVSRRGSGQDVGAAPPTTAPLRPASDLARGSVPGLVPAPVPGLAPAVAPLAEPDLAVPPAPVLEPGPASASPVAFVAPYRYRLALLVPFLLAALFLVLSRMFTRDLSPHVPRAAR